MRTCNWALLLVSLLFAGCSNENRIASLPYLNLESGPHRADFTYHNPTYDIVDGPRPVVFLARQYRQGVSALGALGEAHMEYVQFNSSWRDVGGFDTEGNWVIWSESTVVGTWHANGTAILDRNYKVFFRDELAFEENDTFELENIRYIEKDEDYRTDRGQNSMETETRTLEPLDAILQLDVRECGRDRHSFTCQNEIVRFE